MEDLPVPLSRVELYLAKAAGMDVTVPEAPESRLEQFLAIIAGDTTVEMPTPLSLTEMWLAYVIGVTPDPLLPVEGACYIGNQKVDVRYFAVAAGMPGAVLPPAPQNRKEQYWALIQGGGGGVLKYATGTNITLTDVVRGIEELQYVYGDTFQQTYSGKNSIDNTDITYDFSNVPSIYNHLSTLPTGIRYKTTYSELGSPVVTFKLPIDLTQYIGKVVRMKATFGSKGGIRITRGDETLSTRQIVAAGNTSGETISWTVPNDLGDVKWLAYSLAILEPEGEFTVDFTDLIMTIDNSDMTWEPYTGGYNVPAPNPDYPQDIQVVTGEQTVTVAGKNLWSLASSYTNSKTTNSWVLTDTAMAIPSGNYTFSCETANTNNIQFAWKYADNVPHSSSFTNGKTSVTFTEDVAKVAIRMQGPNSISNIQLELGSTATAYEPYQEATYPIDLTSIELCKIGDYQDYVYKSGDDWYVHKAFAKLELDGSENWMVANMSASRYPFGTDVSGVPRELKGAAISDTYIYDIASAENTGADANKFTFRGRWDGNRFYFMTPKAAVSGSTAEEVVSSFKTFLSGHPTKVYFTPTTTTDTKITDATLVGQLNAIDSAVLPKPVAYITVGATDPNLPASIKISYYGEEE